MSEKSLIAQTKLGQIQGVREGNAIIFKGIPYAKPPLGELRFKRPQAPEPFEGVYAATSYGKRSMQNIENNPEDFYTKEFYTEPIYNTPVSEDCLYLNIWTPDLEPSKKMPVYVFIHGGAFLGGCGHEVTFRTDAYAKRNIILVTLNYRLGMFGFLAHKDLTKEDSYAVGNYGIMDQMAALEWVKNNIEAFGGDPERVTLSGQSAGGLSVETIMACPEANNLYDRVIIQSAGGYPQLLAGNTTLEEGENLGNDILEAAGVSSVDELRKLPAEKLLMLQYAVGGAFFEKTGHPPYGPLINSKLLPVSITESMAAGKINNVPTMIGSNKNDMGAQNENPTIENSPMHKGIIDYSMLCESNLDNPSYIYYFKRELPGDNMGAFHSAELWYMFGTLGKCWRPLTEKDQLLSEQMLDAWSSFIATGNPSCDAVGKWQRCSEKNPYVQVFDIVK